MECIITVWHSLFVYTLSASAFIDSSLHQLDFFLEIFIMETCMNKKVNTEKNTDLLFSSQSPILVFSMFQ